MVINDKSCTVALFTENDFPLSRKSPQFSDQSTKSKNNYKRSEKSPIYRDCSDHLLLCKQIGKVTNSSYFYYTTFVNNCS